MSAAEDEGKNTRIAGFNTEILMVFDMISVMAAVLNASLALGPARPVNIPPNRRRQELARLSERTTNYSNA